jgi:hypothetical protein
LVLHRVELVLLILDKFHQTDALIITHEDLLTEVLDGLLSLEQHPLHDGDGLGGQLGIVVFGQLNHSLKDRRLHQLNVITRDLLDEAFCELIINFGLKETGIAVVNEGTLAFGHFKHLEMLANVPHCKVEVVVQDELNDIHALQLASHHQQVFL